MFVVMSVLIERVRLSVWLEWSPQMLEHHTLWDNRGGGDTEAEDSEEVLRVEVR